MHSLIRKCKNNILCYHNYLEFIGVCDVFQYYRSLRRAIIFIISQIQCLKKVPSGPSRTSRFSCQASNFSFWTRIFGFNFNSNHVAVFNSSQQKENCLVFCCWSSLVNPTRLSTQFWKTLMCCLLVFDHTLITHVHFRIQEFFNQTFRFCKSSWVNAVRSNPFSSGNPRMGAWINQNISKIFKQPWTILWSTNLTCYFGEWLSQGWYSLQWKSYFGKKCSINQVLMPTSWIVIECLTGWRFGEE